MNFRELNESKLDRLSDDELIRYVARAREAGNKEAARRALCVFGFRRYDDLLRFAKLRVRNDEDAEDLVQEALKDLLRATFRGELTGEAVKFLFTILSRRIADYYERRKRRGGGEVQLPEERDDEQGPAPAAARTEDFTEGVEAQDVVERVLEQLNPTHRLVVEYYFRSGFSARETAEKVNSELPDLDTPMTEPNVHQIATRFRQALRRELEQ